MEITDGNQSKYILDSPSQTPTHLLLQPTRQVERNIVTAPKDITVQWRR